MTTGYAGKILIINLTNKSTGVLDTEQYEEFGGGNGMGSAIFWDFCQDKAVSGFDPRNVITVTAGPLCGTLAPYAGRTEICGIGVYSYPVDWFSRSNIGGFFSAMLKYAGWDGIVIEGKADDPVWVNILNDKVTIEDARGLWGLDAAAAQEEIWRRVTGRASFGDWLSLGDAKTTQGPTILCIGPGGESLSRLGTIQTGISMAASHTGFGGVWGAKKLKAISVLGTGGIEVFDPKTLIATRDWLESLIGEEYLPGSPITRTEEGRQTSCSGCFRKCRSRVKSGVLNDSKCLPSAYITDDLIGGKSGSDIIQVYGLNVVDLAPVPFGNGVYINKLYQEGILGPGKAIDSAPLPMDKFEGSSVFAKTLCRAIVNREGIGADLAEGLMRAAEKWGRLEQDLASGLLHKAQWGYNWHWSIPFVEVAYGSLMGERDCNEHQFAHGTWNHLDSIGLSAEKSVEVLTRQMIPYADDPLMLNYIWQGADGSKMKQALATGIYSEHKAKFVAWHRHYTRFWMESILRCGIMGPDFFTVDAPGFSGAETEPKLFNVVTGKNLTFADGMEIGRKIWNLNRAIWVLQGRHRDTENFAEFMYTPAGSLAAVLPLFPSMVNSPMPVYENGKWIKVRLEDMYLDKAGVEQWKTHFYKFEGWDPNSGWPTRNTLEELGLKNVAETLESAEKLGDSP